MDAAAAVFDFLWRAGEPRRRRRQLDENGDTWFISFDADGFPETATAAIVVANKIFWTARLLPDGEPPDVHCT